MWSARRFVGFSSALLGVAVLAASCDGKAGREASIYMDPHPLPQDTMTIAVAEIGRHGGRFVLGQTSAPRTFNANLANENSSTDVTNRLFTSMTGFDNATGQVVPLLAKSWESTPDGRIWTFHIRRGARFSDGHPITSADFMFSVDVIKDPALHASKQDLIESDGKPFEFSAPDSYTVVVRTSSPSALLVPIVGSIMIMPKHVLEPAYRSGSFASAYGVGTAPESLVSSGSWKLKQFVAGEKTVLARNPYWFGVDVKGQRLPYLDELVFEIVPDQNTAALKFHSGELDGLDNVKPEDYRTYKERAKNGDFTLYDLGPSLNSNFFYFNLNTVKKPVKGKRLGEPYVGRVKYAWFKERDFRRAISMAVDREAIIRSVFHGEGVKNWSTTTAGDKQWHTSDVTGHDYDPEGARKLLAGLGYRDRDNDGYLEDAQGNSISFSIKTNGDNAVRMGMCNFIRDDLAKVGIECVPMGVEFNRLVTNVRDDCQYDAMLLGLSSSVPPDPGMAQSVWRSSGSAHYWNMRQARPESPVEARLDQLMDENLRTLDAVERKRIWREMQQLVNEECFFIWLPTVRSRVPVRNRFGNLQPSVIPHRLIWNIERIFTKRVPAGRS